MDRSSAYATLNSSIINPQNAILQSSVSGVQEAQQKETASDVWFPW